MDEPPAIAACLPWRYPGASPRPGKGPAGAPRPVGLAMAQRRRLSLNGPPTGRLRLCRMGGPTDCNRGA